MTTTPGLLRTKVTDEGDGFVRVSQEWDLTVDDCPMVIADAPKFETLTRLITWTRIRAEEWAEKQEASND